jgi:hypothetical protein
MNSAQDIITYLTEDCNLGSAYTILSTKKWNDIPVLSEDDLTRFFQVLYERLVLTTSEEEEVHEDDRFVNDEPDPNNMIRLEQFYSNYLFSRFENYKSIFMFFCRYPRLFLRLNTSHLYQFHRLCVALDNHEHARRHFPRWKTDFATKLEMIKEAKTQCFMAVFEFLPIRYFAPQKRWSYRHDGKRFVKETSKIYDVHQYIERSCSRYLNVVELEERTRTRSIKKELAHYLPYRKNVLWGEH